MIEELADEIDLMNRHLEILRTVMDEEPIGIARLSKATGYPRHKVRYSLRILERNDVIEPTQQGAVTTDLTAEHVADLADRIDALADRLEALSLPSEPAKAEA